MAHRRRGRGRLASFWSGLSTADKTLIGVLGAAVIGAVALIIAPIIPIWLDDDNDASDAAPAESIPIPDIFERLDSNNAETVKNAISSLEIQLTQSNDQPTRQAILHRLVTFVRDRDPAFPPEGAYEYCLQQPHLDYPPEAELALTVIGSRLEADKTFPIDLSNTNLAFARLQDLDFSYVTFDGALMCRMRLNRSDFSNASFVGANLRLTQIVGARGLLVDQLLEAESLYKTTLSLNLSLDLRIGLRIAAEYELYLLPGDHDDYPKG